MSVKARRALLAIFVAIALFPQQLSPVSAISPSPTELEVRSWNSNSSRLTSTQSKTIQNWIVNAVKGDPEKIQCSGWLKAKATAQEKNLAKTRAASVCSKAKALIGGSNITIISTTRVSSNKSLANSVRLSITSLPKAFGRESAIPVSQCKISAPSQTNLLSSGFPMPKEKTLPHSGVIKAVFIGVDFSDYPGVTEVSSWAPGVTKSLHDYFYAMSYGKIDFQSTVLPKYIRMNQKVKDYRLSTKSVSPLEFNSEALNKAADSYDISGYDRAYIFVSPDTPAGLIDWHGEFTGISVPTSDGVFNSFTGPGLITAPYGNPLQWMAHETGHAFGLPDLYNNSVPSGLNQDGGVTRFGAWDVMSTPWTDYGIEMNGWFRFLLGWLPDSDVVCFDGSKVTNAGINIKSVSEYDSTRLILVKISETEVLAIERRSNSTYAKLDLRTLMTPGILVYYIDGKRSLWNAPLQVVPKVGGSVTDLVVRENGTFYTDPFAVSATLGENDKAYFGRITVSSLYQGSSSTSVGIEIK